MVLVVALLVLLVTLARLAVAEAGAARRRATGVALGLAGWLGLTGALAAAGFFADFAGRPPRIVLATAPALLAVAAIATWGRGLARVPATWLVAPQAFRVVMELILWRLAVARVLPDVMTFHGRNFDVLTGLSAPLVAWAMARGHVGPRGVALWNVMGLVLVTSVFLHGLLRPHAVPDARDRSAERHHRRVPVRLAADLRGAGGLPAARAVPSPDRHAMETSMTDTDRQTRVDAADVAALIERTCADLALSEEPSNFAAALEAGGTPGRQTS